jgi:hypothetical protein
VLFVALVALFFLVGKAIERLRNRSKPPNESSGQAISRPSADGYGNALGNFASMIASGHDDSSSAPPQAAQSHQGMPQGAWVGAAGRPGDSPGHWDDVGDVGDFLPSDGIECLRSPLR